MIEQTAQNLQRHLQKNHHVILCEGPNGSGKLSALLSTLVNYIGVEELSPRECHTLMLCPNNDMAWFSYIKLMAWCQGTKMTGALLLPFILKGQEDVHYSVSQYNVNDDNDNATRDTPSEQCKKD